ncbi:hypothetical protein FOCG_07361 [Fusarium oxysporum f. sp. radicis-lycopersici 26381]|nr:hypothetical protein FOWG_06658 [Fusarium oxysporum f. sp. lycopersici MN25]EXL54287.1 hypothetical protein FOCG_07361 [Fusarium oxysporum f. sp. radicis-lycopersici 26381]
MYVVRSNKSCDQCRNRKVRCLVPPTSPNTQAVCYHCTKRQELCHFSKAQRRFRSRVSPSSSSPVVEPTCTNGPDASPQDAVNAQQRVASCFIDDLMLSASPNAILYDEFSVFKIHDQRVASSGLAFFSQHKIDSLTKRLGNPRLRQLVDSVEDLVRSRLSDQVKADPWRSRYRALEPVHISKDETQDFIQHYFIDVHPVFPFLDQVEFRQRALETSLPYVSDTDPQYIALYYAILALGCQQSGGGSFDAGEGKAWELFRMAISHVTDVHRIGDSLMTLQALTAMAIFTMNTASMQMDQSVLAEMTRMALALRYHKSMTLGENPATCQRTFWVVYHLEKQYSFQARRSSAIADYDIGCPIPSVPDSQFGDYNWFWSSIRFSRLLSIAYESVFSTTASTRSAASQLASVGQVRNLLEQWRQSIPEDFRPGEPLRRVRFTDDKTKQVALLTHCYHHHLTIALERAVLFLNEDGEARLASSRNLLHAARAIIELTRYIDVEPHTPIYILGILPSSALFILFDFVVHNPSHPATRGNLTLLDIASGHFSILEHSSSGSIPGNCLSEFAHIARQYVQNFSSRPSEASRAAAAAGEDRQPGIHSGTSHGTSHSGSQENRQELCSNELTTSAQTGVDGGDGWNTLEPLYYPVTDDFLDWMDMQSISDTEVRMLFSSAFPS